MAVYLIYDGDELIATLSPDDPENSCLGQRGGEFGDLCGGCDACQLQQATYAELRVVVAEGAD